MIKRPSTLNRPAIAMIELIFAIVIMGIVLMSAPNLLQITARSGYVAIQQESINEASSHLNMILSYPWDRNDSNESYLPPILHVSNGDSDLDEYNNTGRRIGTPKHSQRSFVRADGKEFNASAIPNYGGTTGDEKSIEDFNGETYHLTQIESATADYIEKGTDINITTRVRYISDIPTSGNYKNSAMLTYDLPIVAAVGTTNIKEINVVLTSNNAAQGVEELQKKIILKAFSCNIGATELEMRSF